MAAPVILFGAFDRHNFGDLLFPHIAAALLPGRELLFAGLAGRDLRSLGGHRMQALHRLAAEGRTQGAHLLHVGGEVLTCTARQAAVMLLQPQEVDATLAYVERHPEAEPDWLHAMLGSGEPMPYVADRGRLPGMRGMAFTGTGGVALQTLPPALRQAVVGRLRSADAVSVRDAITHATLRDSGVDAMLLPDPAAMVERLFGEAVRARGARPPVAGVRSAFPQGYLAVQLPAEFGDDATLEAAAAQLKHVHVDTGLGLVLFRAGAAPWHDDLHLLQRLAARFAPHEAQVFGSLQLWDTCALLAHAAASVGSSLHAWIVASAFGVPAAGLVKPQDDGKLAAYVRTWAGSRHPPAWPLNRLAEGVDRALCSDAPSRRQRAEHWAAASREGLELHLRALAADSEDAPPRR